MSLKLSDLVLKVSKDLANAITRKRCHQVFEIDTKSPSGWNLSEVNYSENYFGFLHLYQRCIYREAEG